MVRRNHKYEKSRPARKWSNHRTQAVSDAQAQDHVVQFYKKESLDHAPRSMVESVVSVTTIADSLSIGPPYTCDVASSVPSAKIPQM